jgi:hypothetical protein
VKLPDAILRGFGYLTLDPSPRLRRLRERQPGVRLARPLPPLPDSCYGPVRGEGIAMPCHVDQFGAGCRGAG